MLRTGAPGPIEADHLGDQSLVRPKQVGGNANARSAVTSGDPLPDHHLNMRGPGRREPGLGHWLATPLFIREPDGTLVRYDPEGGAEHEADDAEPQESASLEFALEAYLEAFLLDNWDGIDWGRPLELWESESGTPGAQLATPIGRLAFLCRDTETDALVVVELKRGSRQAESSARLHGI